MSERRGQSSHVAHIGGNVGQSLAGELQTVVERIGLLHAAEVVGIGSEQLVLVGYDAVGNAAGEQSIRTAGKPAKLTLDVWTQSANLSPLTSHLSPLKASGDDFAFITVSLTDANGTLIPDASDQLTFEVTGAGTFEAVCNGDATSLEPFKQPTMKLFNGQLVVIVRSGHQPGTLTLKVTDTKLNISESIDIQIN